MEEFRKKFEIEITIKDFCNEREKEREKSRELSLFRFFVFFSHVMYSKWNFQQNMFPEKNNGSYSNKTFKFPVRF